MNNENENQEIKQDVFGDFSLNAEEIAEKIRENVIQEKFREVLLKNEIAGDYSILFDDNFVFNQNDIGVSGIVYVYKENDKSWIVWDTYEDGTYFDIKKFNKQEDAYIDASSRRGVKLELDDLSYDEKNIKEIVYKLLNSKSFIYKTINNYKKENTIKLFEWFSLISRFDRAVFEEYKEDNNLSVSEIAKKLSKK